MGLESEEDLALASAVDQWFRYYNVERDDKDGHRSGGDLATLLIGTFVGVASTKINAPSSATVH